MELVPIIKTFLFYGTLAFLLLFIVSYILSKIKNSNKREEDRLHDLVPNYVNKSQPNIRVIKRSDPFEPRVSNVTSSRRETADVRSTRNTNEKTNSVNPNIYYIKNSTKVKQPARFEDIQSGPTINELKVRTQTKRFEVINTNLQAASTDGILNRFSKSYSYGR